MRTATVAIAVMVVSLAAVPAAAHVDVLPKRVADGEAREFLIRVPNERDVATTAVLVRFPPQVAVFSLREPPPGWRVGAVRSSDGRVAAARWIGGRIGVGRFQNFSVLGTPFGAGTTVWEAEQTYADGIVKPWTAEPDPPGTESAETGTAEPGPAAAVEVVASDELVVGAASDDGSGAAIWLGVIAIAIAAFAAIGVGLLWSTRPMALPPSDGDGS